MPLPSPPGIEASSCIVKALCLLLPCRRMCCACVLACPYLKIAAFLPSLSHMRSTFLLGRGRPGNRAQCVCAKLPPTFATLLCHGKGGKPSRKLKRSFPFVGGGGLVCLIAGCSGGVEGDSGQDDGYHLLPCSSQSRTVCFLPSSLPYRRDSRRRKDQKTGGKKGGGKASKRKKKGNNPESKIYFSSFWLGPRASYQALKDYHRSLLPFVPQGPS